MSEAVITSAVLSGRFPRARLAVAAAFALNGALLGAWAARVPAVVAKHDLSEGTLGLMLLMMGLGALVSFPVAGRMADRRGAYPVTRVLAAVYVFSIVLVGLAPTPVLLGAALFLFGIGHGAMDVTMNSWAAEVERGMGRSVMSSFHAMWSLGAGLGAGGGWLATRVDLPVAEHFPLAALAVAAIFGPVMRVSWVSLRTAQPAGNPAFAFPKGALVLVGLIALSAGLGEGAAADWSAVFLTDIVHTTPSVAALGYAVFSLAMVAMRLNVDRLITRHGPVAVARFSGLAAASGYLLALGVATLPATLAGVILMGMGYAAVIPLAFSRAAADPEVPPGQAIASVATLGYGAMLMGPPAIGFVAEATSLRVSFALVALMALLAAALAPVLRR
ncbi:MFS transporter [Sagittula salina]|uniref:MFS transporter n=1 Tax=Sagittula salina TaxID=2820268 RepID=A0A940MTX9_9RHOB|nr:MFS transporter [Sagittula salina]MBP0482894.1 MFS transporter [Sagittula salina]